MMWVRSLCLADHDGPGPQGQVLYASGSRRTASGELSNLYRWDGERWTAVLPGFESVSRVYTLPHAAAGLPAGTVLVAGVNSTAGGVKFLRAYDGQNLTLLGPATLSSYSSTANINAITTWDPDGSGPQQPVVVVGGSFSLVGGVPVQNIAAWNGTAWAPVSTRPSGVTALTTFDADAEGPGAPLLIANNAAFNGSSWQTLGTLSGLSSLAVFDEDGPGPQPAQLYAGGVFSGLPPVVRWNGSAWVAVGPGIGTGAVSDLRVVDLDGAGPEAPVLVAAQNAFNSVATVLRAGVWAPLSSPLSAQSQFLVEAFDVDGPGPRGVELVAAPMPGSTGTLGQGITTPISGLISWSGSRWGFMGSDVINGSIYALHQHDPDGPGPLPGEVYASGSFTYAGGVPADGLARWDGWRWVGLGTPTVARSISRLTSHDFDGTGPQPSSLVGTDFQTSTAQKVMRWDGTAWVTVGVPFSAFQVYTAETFDADGPGGDSPALYIGGSGISTQTGTGGVASYTTGPRFTHAGLPNFNAHALLKYDPDGPGPLGETLHAYGLGQQDCFFRWSAGAWQPIIRGSPQNGQLIMDAGTWDPDGDGPHHAGAALPCMVMFLDGRQAFGPIFHDGIRGRGLGVGPAEFVQDVHAHDPDGPGPVPPQLINAYTATTGLGAVRRHVGGGWVDLSGGFLNIEVNVRAVSALTTIDPDGQGPLPPELWIGGRFIQAGGREAGSFARWRLTGAVPLITQHPQPATPCSNTPVVLSVGTDNEEVYQFRWRIDDPVPASGWQFLTDGPVVVQGRQVGIASGAATPTLTFTPAADTSTYLSCVITGGCGGVFTAPTAVSTAACCGSIDYNHDGLPGTAEDIAAYFECLAGRCCPTCDSMDFNGDGDYGTDADIEAFFRVMGGSGC